jgi:MFS family permease
MSPGARPLERQRQIFLVASGLSTMGSFAGLTAKGWVLMDGTHQPMLLALHFALLSLPTLVVSGPAGVVTDRHGCERVLVWAQWGLLLGAALGALAIPLSHGQTQAALLLVSTLVVGLASAYELTARNKYCALLVNRPEELGPYLTSFSVVFNVGKLVGPPIGGALVAFTGPAMALLLDAATYLLPIASVVWLLRPHREQEQRSQGGASASLGAAWRNCGPDLRHVLRFTGLFCLVGFFHPGLAPLIAAHLVGPSPQDLGLFTSILAAGSICGGLVLQRNSEWLSQRPGLLLGGSGLITALAQMGMAQGDGFALWSLAMAFLIGAGTAALLSGCNLIAQVAAPQVLRGRMAGLSQIAFLGGGGLSGLIAAGLAMRWGLGPTFGLLGSLGTALALLELLRRGRRQLALVS